MAIDPGPPDATSGVTRVLFEAMDASLCKPLEESLRKTAPPLPDADIKSAVDDVRKNCKPLAHAIAVGMVSALCKEVPSASSSPVPVFAETYSSAKEEPRFWSWLSGFVTVFKDWEPTTPDGIELHKRLESFLDSTPVPTELRGVIR